MPVSTNEANLGLPSDILFTRNFLSKCDREIMVWIVVTINLLLSLGLLWAAWQVWQLRVALANAANSIDSWASASQRGLSGSSPAILIVQKGSATLKQKYWELLPQIQKIKLVLFTLGRLQSLIRGVHLSQRHWRKSRPEKLKRRDLHVQRRG